MVKRLISFSVIHSATGVVAYTGIERWSGDIEELIDWRVEKQQLYSKETGISVMVQINCIIEGR